LHRGISRQSVRPATYSIDSQYTSDFS
jgi:hypothetical protein